MITESARRFARPTSGWLPFEAVLSKLTGRFETWTVRFRDRKQCQQGVFPFWHAVWFP
jgi:hypothetical protein